jgi:cytochrome oxidase Cu insertion factor (SCO1/SenC/PrrC family)
LRYFRPIALALCIGLAMPATAATPKPWERSAEELMDVLMWNREPIGGPFSLVDQYGATRTPEHYRGKLLLIYFGFTSCVAICPTDLLRISQAIEQMGPAGEDVQPIFITLDPARDTPELLAPYLQSFHPRFVGLGGSQAAVAEAAQAYRVYFKRVPIGDSYTVDHSAFLYLMDRSGGFLGFFPPTTPAERIVQGIRPYLSP